MLNLIKSNKIELLTEILAKEILVNPVSITEEINISVNNYLLGKWMRDQITISNKISSLYNFKTIDKFTEDLIKKIYPEEIFEGWNFESLVWLILNSIDEIRKYDESWPLKNWLQKYNKETKFIDKDIFVLSNKIAKIYTEYLIYRPEMINRWHNIQLGDNSLYRGLDHNEYWQPILFKIIEKKIGNKSVTYFMLDVIRNCNSNNINIKKNIPKQIYILSINNLSKFQIEFYLKISQFTRVNIYQLSPGINLWNRINIEEGVIFKKENRNNQLFNIIKIFGKFGSNFEKLFDESINKLEIEINSKPFYSNPENCNKFNNKTILQQIQKKIIDDNNNTLNISDNDDSLSLSGQYDMNDQLEFIRNKIFKFTQKDKNLRYDDIAIVCPNINNVKPYIKRTFDDDFINKSKIPYLIANNDYFEISSVFRFIIEILELAGTKVTIEKLNTFLSDSFVKDIYDLSKKDSDEIIKILQDCGFDWGLDAQERSGEFMNTLDWCIQRISLGIMFDDKKFLIENKISSFIPNNNSLDLHKCINLLNQIRKDINSLRGNFSIKVWIEKFRKILIAFDVKSEFYKEQINEINLILDNYLKDADFSLIIDINAMREILFNCFNKIKNISVNRNNQILIGNLETVRLIPHKIIFLIDMNNIHYPRKSIEEKINLINKFFTIGDMVKIDKEKYLILELLISCREKFIITWSNYDEKNNKLEVATPIRELISYFESIFDRKNLNNIFCNVVNKTVFKNTILEKNNIKYALISKIDLYQKNFKNKLYKLSDLISWYREPQKYWLRKNNLYFDSKFIHNPNDEDLNGFEKTKLLNNIIEDLKLDNPNLNDELFNIDVRGYIIHQGINCSGNNLNVRVKEIMKIIESFSRIINEIKNINLLYLKENSNKQEYFISNNQIIEVFNSNLNVSKLSEVWIKLLFACSLDSSIKGTKIIYRADNSYKLKEITSPGLEESKLILSEYLNIYKNYLKKCLPVPPESSFYFLEAKHNLKNPVKAFIKYWEGSDGFIEGERDKSEMKFCFGDKTSYKFFVENENYNYLASKIYLPLVKLIKK